MVTRRQAIKTLGQLAGAATLSKLFTGCGGNDGPNGITTYVFMMLENRSYDHMFGARSMLEGKLGDGLQMQMSNPDLNNVPVPIYNPDKMHMCDPDPPHDWDPLHASWNMGACDGFVKQHQMAHGGMSLTDPMQYLVREQVPASWALADAYTTCDRWFCAVMGPTLPNRAYWHTGTSLGIGKDPAANSMILNAFDSGLPVPSIYNRLHDKGVDWAYYYGSIPVVSLLANPGPYQLDVGPNDGTGNIRRFGDAEGMAGTFFTDAAKGKLPTVCYIDPYFYLNDDHPPIHPINGQQLIMAVYTALAKSPQWKNCLLVITYDENGGFFDHVSPPKTTDDTLAKYGQDGFDQLGFRVPAMVIGPYVKPGYVSHTIYNHTSALKHIQETFGTESLNARTDAAPDLSDCIDMDRLMKGQWAKPITLDPIDISQWPMDDTCTHTGSGFRELDPISVWTDQNPGKFGALDLRPHRDSYNAGIRRFLQDNGLLK
jgi:phospholipase C